MLAGLARLSERAPLVVVTATGAEPAERLLPGDLRLLHSEAAVEPCCPAWETLPFERVSPEVGTMGRRLAVLWHLFGDPDEARGRPAGGGGPGAGRCSSGSGRGGRRPVRWWSGR